METFRPSRVWTHLAMLITATCPILEALATWVVISVTVGLASASLPANAAIAYSFAGGLSDGSSSASLQFIITTPDFITVESQLSPYAASCVTQSSVVESCGISGVISLSPRSFDSLDSIAFSALFKPFFSDFAFSQDFSAAFGVPPGIEIFETPGMYTATSRFNLAVATLQVSELAEPIPEPSTLLLLIGGLSLIGVAVRSRRTSGRQHSRVLSPVSCCINMGRCDGPR